LTQPLSPVPLCRALHLARYQPGRVARLHADALIRENSFPRALVSRRPPTQGQFPDSAFAPPRFWNLSHTKSICGVRPWELIESTKWESTFMGRGGQQLGPLGGGGFCRGAPTQPADEPGLAPGPRVSTPAPPAPSALPSQKAPLWQWGLAGVGPVTSNGFFLPLPVPGQLFFFFRPRPRPPTPAESPGFPCAPIPSPRRRGPVRGKIPPGRHTPLAPENLPERPHPRGGGPLGSIHPPAIKPPKMRFPPSRLASCPTDPQRQSRENERNGRAVIDLLSKAVFVIECRRSCAPPPLAGATYFRPSILPL